VLRYAYCYSPFMWTGWKISWALWAWIWVSCPFRHHIECWQCSLWWNRLDGWSWTDL